MPNPSTKLDIGRVTRNAGEDEAGLSNCGANGRAWKARSSSSATAKVASASKSWRTWLSHKTGTGGTRNGITSATNYVGITTLPDGRHLAVAAFVSDSAANDDTRDAIIARLAKAAWDRAQSLGR